MLTGPPPKFHGTRDILVRGIGLLRTRRQRLERRRPEELHDFDIRPAIGHQEKRLTRSNPERSLTLC